MIIWISYARVVNVKCCVPGCVSNNRRFHHVKYHTLPKDACRRIIWKHAIKKRTKNVKVVSYMQAPLQRLLEEGFLSIFPLSEEWQDIVKSYNKYVVKKFTQSQAVGTYTRLPYLMKVPVCSASAKLSEPSAITNFR
jgi:hypothetical protein